MKLAWIDFHKVGESVHTENGDVVDITPEYAATMVANFYACKDKGYAVPVLRNHGSEDSWIYGDVIEMRVEGTHLQAGVKFTREEERQAFNEGLMREFSPGFSTNWLDPHTGEKMGPTMLELSFCGLAYQRNLRQPQEANPVQLKRQYLHTLSTKEIIVTDEPKEEEVTIEERMTRLEAKVEEVMAKYMTEPEEEMADEPEEEMMVEDEEKKEMSARIQFLEDQLVLSEIAKAGVKDGVENLVKLARTDKKLFGVTLKMMSRKEQSEIGTMGAAETSAPGESAESVAKAAQAAGKTGPGHLALYLSSNHPTFVGKINDVRKHL